jgi:hypothetical protein
MAEILDASLLLSIRRIPEERARGDVDGAHGAFHSAAA